MKAYNIYRDQMLAAADCGDMTAIFNVGLDAIADQTITDAECTHLREMACELMDAVCRGGGPC